jgi:hypothetical protein
VAEFKLTRKAAADLYGLVDFSPPYWIYYDRVGGVLRILRIYHGAREPL